MTANRKLAKGDRHQVQPLVDEVVRIVRDHMQEGRLRGYLFGYWNENKALAYWTST